MIGALVPLVSLPIALLLGTLGPDSLTGPGVSRELATYRANQIRNVRYELTLDVTRLDSARGRARVRFDRAGRGDLILDFRGPRVSVSRVNGVLPIGVTFNGAHLRIPAAALANGANLVELDFTAMIAPAGASIIRFHDATDNTDYLYTLLVPSDANALFPCFDQPDIKARLTLALTTPRGWQAVANGELASADSSSSTTTFRFGESDPISTYLMAFAAGPWSAKSKVVDGRPITMYVRASRAHEAEDTLITLNARAITWLERYTAIPFPFKKFDLVLAPAFPFGGMEHPGAVFYNEDRFIFREAPTRNQLLGREATINHEVAHQWFGDLVTMRWFDDLWLKEGFATYLAAVMQDAMQPEANAWRTFFLSNRPSAYAVDASRGTTPVWQALANLDQAKSNYGAIVYNKAPGILKQLNSLVGDTVFRDGLRTYLKRHAYDNATWRDLLTVIGVAADHDLAPWGREYILRPGMPVITQRVTVDARGWMLELTQHSAQQLSGAAPWPIRTQLLVRQADGSTMRLPIMLTSTVTRRRFEGAPPRFVFANGRDDAYALIRLDSASVAGIEREIGSIDDVLLRTMLWSALWDQVRSAALPPPRFVSLALRELPRERDDQLVPFIVGRMSNAVNAYLCEDQATTLRADAERVLAAGASDTTRGYSARKAQLDALIGLARSPLMLARFDAALDGTELFGLPLGAPTRWSIVTRLLARSHASASARLTSETRRDSTSDGQRRAFVAGAARPDSATKARYWNRYFNDAVLNEDWVTASLSAFNDSDQPALTRRYLVPALDTLPWIQKNRRIFFLGSWLGSFLSGQRDATSLRLVERFLAEHSRLPKDLREKILQNADELERVVRIRAGCRQ